MKTKRVISTSITAEIRLASGFSAAADSSDAPTECMIARIERSNYRLAEALLVQSNGSGDFFQSIRTQISRGQLDDAELLLSQALADEQDSDSITSDLLRLELSRTHYHNGLFLKTIELTQKTLKNSELSGLPRLTLLQIQSACWFELGEWDKALKDIEAIRCLQLLYPVAQSGFYSEALRVKVLARRYGLAEAEDELSKLTHRYFSSESLGNHDKLLTLLRLRCDLNRLAGLPVASVSRACYLLAEAMGDELYSALALVDLQFSESGSLQLQANTRLKVLRTRFKKVDQLLTLNSEKGVPSESSRTLWSFKHQVIADHETLNENYSSLIFPTRQIRVDFQTLTLHYIRLQKQSQEIFLKLSEGETSRENLFRSIWNLSFVHDRHDLILRNALLRARKQARVQILSENLSVRLKNTLVVNL